MLQVKPKTLYFLINKSERDVCGLFAADVTSLLSPVSKKRQDCPINKLSAIMGRFTYQNLVDHHPILLKQYPPDFLSHFLFLSLKYLQSNFYHNVDFLV